MVMMVMVMVMTEVMGVMELSVMETRVMGFSPRDDGDDLFVCN